MVRGEQDATSLEVAAVPETNLEQLKAGMEALTNMKLKSTGGGVGVKLTIKNK